MKVPLKITVSLTPKHGDCIVEWRVNGNDSRTMRLRVCSLTPYA